MFRKVVSVVVVFSLLSLSFFSCSDETATRPEDSTEVRNVGLGNPEVILSESQEVRELIDIRNEMIARALASGVSGTELADIVSSNDEERFASVLGYSHDELSAIGLRIKELGISIRERYAEVRQTDRPPVPVCVRCSFADMAENWNNLLMTNRASDFMLGDGEVMLPAPDPSQKGVTCQWASYVATLVGCTVFGSTPLYFACTIVALCQFCSGGWVSTFCQK